MPGGNVGITIRIGGEYKGKRAIRAANNDLGRLMGATRQFGRALNVNIGDSTAIAKFTEGLTGASARMSLLAHGAGMAVGAIKAMGEALGQASKRREQLKALRNTIVGIDAILADAAAKTSGFFSRQELQDAAARLHAFGISAEMTGDVLETVAKTSLRLGLDAKFALDSLVEGVSKQSALRLDNLSITKEAVVTEAELADRLGVTAEQVSKGAALTATMTEALKQLNAQNAGMVDLQQTQIGSLKLLTRAFEAFAEDVGEFVAGTAIDLADWVTGNDREWSKLERKISTASSGMADSLKDMRLNTRRALGDMRSELDRTIDTILRLEDARALAGLGRKARTQDTVDEDAKLARNLNMRAAQAAEVRAARIAQEQLEKMEEWRPPHKGMGDAIRRFRTRRTAEIAEERTKNTKRFIDEELKRLTAQDARARAEKVREEERQEGLRRTVLSLDDQLAVLKGTSETQLQINKATAKWSALVSKVKGNREELTSEDVKTLETISARLGILYETDRVEKKRARDAKTTLKTRQATRATEADRLRLLIASHNVIKGQELAAAAYVESLRLQIKEQELAAQVSKKEITREKARLDFSLATLESERRIQGVRRQGAEEEARAEERRKRAEQARQRQRLNALPEAARIEEGFRGRARDLLGARGAGVISQDEFGQSMAELARDREAAALDARIQKMRQFSAATNEMAAALASHQDETVQAIGRSLQAFDANLEGIAKGGPAAIVGIGNVIGAALGDMRAAWAVQSIAELAAGFATLVTNPVASAGHFTASALYATAAATAKPSKRSAGGAAAAGGQTVKALTPAESQRGGGGATYVINSPIVIGGSDQEIGAKFQRIMKAPAGTGRGVGAV